MSLALDTVSTLSSITLGTVFTWTHNGAASPSNYLVIVAFAYYDGGNNITPSIVTFGGQTMTLIGTDKQAASEPLYFYGLINPPTGSQTVSVTLTPVALGNFTGGAWSFTGANQTTGWHNFVSTHSTTPPISITITSAVGEITCAAVFEDGTPTISTNQTQQWNFLAGGVRFGGDTATGAASITDTWSGGSSTALVLGGVSIIAVPPPPTIGLPSSMTVPIISVQSW